MIFNGLFDLSLSDLIILTLVLTHVTIVSVTIFLHRHQAHRALELHPLLSHFFRLWLWLTTGMVTREWVAIHRKHHAKCETEDDPHSPQTRGLSKVLWQGAELYQEEAGNAETLERYGKGTPDDWLERNLYQRHNYSGIVLLLMLEIVLLGPAGITVWAIQMIWIPFWAAGVINGIGHYWGYRNFEIPNTSTNILPWGLFIGGEELHNNHHAFASSAKLSNRWWELDLGWFYIRTFSVLGLARVLKVAPKRSFIDERPQLDMDAIKALTANRLQLFSDYRRKVMKPVFRDEIRRAKRPIRRLYRSAQRLVRRDRMLLSDSDLVQLKEILDTNAALNKVYEFKLKLQAIWDQQASSHDKRLEALSQWCAQAEASGVEALREFVSLLRSYGMTPAR
ncbi:MAG: fatty acid desaturase [Candidatus Thiodiazotropha sp. (ex Ctena orbiculata)]|uniref:Fatty acid desaturase n=1 Tax=Candidatus Thiodiazotropha taylori TaxID=2792791 RepID=A0A944MC16_9GAMM|nr:fatty acid desaturase [Candidatus Thiodiazotropha taylori]MBT3027130.1 fatty acid desaturase [Candidatus Thiodiazotropha taylori]MBT3034764.1 fatty acid desaturase [Candidatus Thiodiazotropha taylori]MBV2137321.1 fatty acid desaturase [Candidatus Thiodiazotropha taylori]PUB87456.1 MAG: acyl-CoA desaturase [gamma proteobacterium symbiont of Ctena orbiculata]